MTLWLSALEQFNRSSVTTKNDETTFLLSLHLRAIASPRRFHPSVDRTPSSKRLRTRTRPTPPPARRQRRWALPPALPLRTAFRDCHPQRALLGPGPVHLHLDHC